MNYKLCELYNKYTILSNYEQSTHLIQIACPSYTTKKIPRVTVTITKKRFIGSNSQVY